MTDRPLCIDLPAWAEGRDADDRLFGTDEERMRVAIELALQNVRHGTGGPFGAAVFEIESGRLVAVGVNSVVRLGNSSLHAEIVAFMRAQSRVGNYTLAAPGLPAHALYSSCDPCAMCLGAVLWAGVRRLVCGASRQDAESLRFDEGPVFPQSYDYLRRRGLQVVHGVLRDEARAALELYGVGGGVIYNP
ncbi:MAG TPA: nucleoside deaminase [Gemmatimonadaceae bacterium]